MDSRCRFLHYRWNEAVTQKDSLSRVMVNPVQAVRLVRSEVRALRLGRDVERN